MQRPFAELRPFGPVEQLLNIGDFNPSRPTGGETRVAFATPVESTRNYSSSEAFEEADGILEALGFGDTEYDLSATPRGNHILYEATEDNPNGLTDIPHLALDAVEIATQDLYGGEAKSDLMVAGPADDMSVQSCSLLTDPLSDEAVEVLSTKAAGVAGANAEQLQNRVYIGQGDNNIPHAVFDLLELIVHRVGNVENQDVTYNGLQARPIIE